MRAHQAIIYIQLKAFVLKSRLYLDIPYGLPVLRSTLGVDLGKTRQHAFDDYRIPNAFWNYDAMPYVAIMDADINRLNWSNSLTYSNRSLLIEEN